MTEPVIELEGVGKSYRFFQMSDVSLRLDAGQILGFVGPNGAGKTTTIGILMGMIRQDHGTVRVLGHQLPAEQAAAKRDIGFVSEDMRLQASATLAWHMRFVSSVYGAWDSTYADTLLKRFNLHPDQAVKALSHGERVKASLLLVLARRPRLLLLDEPTTGLDPVARHEVLAELMDVVRDERRAILFSSHNTQDVEQISDQIAFIDRGRIIDSSDKGNVPRSVAASASRRASGHDHPAAGRRHRHERRRARRRCHDQVVHAGNRLRPTRAPGSSSATCSR